MTTRTCPVCGLEQDQAATECARCAWDFSPLLGTAEQVREVARARLEEARTAWRERRYNPDLVPELARDPFETLDEFFARIAERPWYVGEAELQKAGYDIATGRFPVEVRSLRDWAGRWVNEKDQFYVILPRDPARALYRRSPIWSLYAWLVVQQGQSSCERLVLVTPDGELTVENGTAADRVQVLATASPSLQGTPLGRFRDLGDGTVLDPATGLQWMRGALGQTWNGKTCIGESKVYQWAELLVQAEDVNRRGGFAGHQDWRVPTIEELKTLILKGVKPAIDQQAFSGEVGWFWSSSPTAGYSNYAWSVGFSHGYVYDLNKDFALYVRLVRGGQ